MGEREDLSKGNSLHKDLPQRSGQPTLVSTKGLGRKGAGAEQVGDRGAWTLSWVRGTPWRVHEQQGIEVSCEC